MLIGIDIIEIEKLKPMINDEAVLKKIFTKLEIESMMDYDDRHKAESFAGKFAAKEAFAKAIGSGFNGQIKPLDIEVLNDKSGKPFIILHNHALKEMEHMNVKSHEVSISHCDSYAVASIILH